MKILGYQPYDLKEGARHWDQIKDQVAEANLNYLRRFSPNLTDDKILAKIVDSPLDFERMNPHNWHGSCHGGAGPVAVGAAAAHGGMGTTSHADPWVVSDRSNDASRRFGDGRSRAERRHGDAQRFWNQYRRSGEEEDIVDLKRTGELMKPGRGSLVVLSLFMIVSSLVFTVAISAQTVNQEVARNPMHPAAPAQPIPYSHKKHLAMELECQMCHKGPDPGAQMTFLATATCMTCHATLATHKPAIQKLAEFSKSGQPVRWVRVYKVLPGVNWTHRKHLEAGVHCETCHGDVAQMGSMSEVTSVTTMMFALAATRKATRKRLAADTCHSWPKAADAVFHSENR